MIWMSCKHPKYRSYELGLYKYPSANVCIKLFNCNPCYGAGYVFVVCDTLNGCIMFNQIL